MKKIKIDVGESQRFCSSNERELKFIPWNVDPSFLLDGRNTKTGTDIRTSDSLKCSYQLAHLHFRVSNKVGGHSIIAGKRKTSSVHDEVESVQQDPLGDDCCCPRRQEGAFGRRAAHNVNAVKLRAASSAAAHVLTMHHSCLFPTKSPGHSPPSRAL